MSRTAPQTQPRTGEIVDLSDVQPRTGEIVDLSDAQPRTGEIVDLSDAQVRLRIQVPRKVPVRHNGTPTVGLDLEERFDGEDRSSKAVHHITCHKNDQIAICNNIIIAALGFHRSVWMSRTHDWQSNGDEPLPPCTNSRIVDGAAAV